MYEQGFDLAKRLFDLGENPFLDLTGMVAEYKHGFNDFVGMASALDLLK